MSAKKKYPHAEAMVVANEMQARLNVACERIAIAGSLRRGKAFVSDVEVLFVPRLTERPDGLFDRRIVSVADEVLEEMLATNVLAKRPNVNGSFTWGVANKLAIHCATGIPVDFFGTTPENWWVSLVIRTGSKETNLRLTTGANKRGASLMAYGCGIKWSNGEIWAAHSEHDVFDLCKVPYLEPENR